MCECMRIKWNSQHPKAKRAEKEQKSARTHARGAKIHWRSYAQSISSVGRGQSDYIILCSVCGLAGFIAYCKQFGAGAYFAQSSRSLDSQLGTFAFATCFYGIHSLNSPNLISSHFESRSAYVSKTRLCGNVHVFAQETTNHL